ncbi:iron dicitrate transport regulator FecR [Bordetella genomosp. 12]|uniref:Iron dicitrate transport regulator FecR n=2 Tax=Bordetella genomosp. 12 TaxID=463035 RepID=A0A261VF80_9BORD|nr:iron dicitrate transport regulator FecR [Bordetella genomosp. 12]
MAGGQPISEATADAAAEWLTILMSGEATPEERQRWQQWRAANPEHERAWQHVEAVTGRRLPLMQSSAAYQTLSPYHGASARSRRKALRLLLWGGVLGGSALLASRSQTWQTMTADYRSDTGQQRAIALDDGTTILLNTASAIDVRFDSDVRWVRLVAGQAMIRTGHALINGRPDPRPFIVQTAQGRIRALGTRFMVRQEDDRSAVAVLESAVEITPLSANARRLDAGESAFFTRHGVDAPAAVTDRELAWTQGQIIAEDLPLADFLAELSRYRPGLLRCDPSVAHLRLSGVFPLQDTDNILDMLPKFLPVKISQRTRYWVVVQPQS